MSIACVRIAKILRAWSPLVEFFISTTEIVPFHQTKNIAASKKNAVKKAAHQGGFIALMSANY